MRIAAAFAFLALATASVIACSSTTTTTGSQAAADSGATGEAGSEDTDAGSEPAGPMTLTSTAFEDGDVLPALHTCDGEGSKKEVSPPLSWTPGPEGTLSYAIVFKDDTNGLVHGAIYDIPADVSSLEEGKWPGGAKQSLSYKGQPGYAGPCPPDGEHEYVFTLYAVKVESLTGLTKDSKGADVEKAILKQDLTSSKLTAKYTKK